MGIKSIIGATCACLTVVSINANAMVVNSSIGLYDVTTVTGSYSEHSALLQDQVWWGDSGLAYEMMSLTEGFDGLGYPNAGWNESPYFAFDANDIEVIAWTTATGCWDSLDCRAFQIELEVDDLCGAEYGYPCFWAVASAVPIPATVWLFGSGLLGLIGIARRKKA